MRSATKLVQRAFESLPHSTVIVDREGRIAAVNDAWRSFALENGAARPSEVGDSYLVACDRAAAEGEETAARAALELRTLLARGSGAASVIYPCHSPGTQRWFEARMVAFSSDDGNVVLIIHEDVTAQELARQAVGANERRLHAVIDAMPIGLWIMDVTGRIVHGNPAGVRIWAGARLVGPEQFGEYKAWWASTGEPIAADEWAGARAIRHGEVSIDEEIEIECFDGSRKSVLNSALPLRGADGAIEGAIIVNLDVTDARRATTALRESEQRWRTLFDLLPVGAAILDAKDRMIEHNPALERILGLTREEIESRRYRGWRFRGQDGAMLDESQMPSARARRTNRPISSFEITVERADGTQIATSVSAAPLPQPRGGVVVITSDVTSQVRARKAEREAKAALERALLEQTENAKTDYLTQVANRRHFFEVLQRELALAVRHRHPISIVLVDIDHFKAINDRYGHETGDEVLRRVAQAMKGALRATDTLARHGGEEFIVLLPYTDLAAAGVVAGHLRAAVADCGIATELDGIAATASIGVATAHDGDSIETLLRRADDAMYAAKSAGRNRVVIAPAPEDEQAGGTADPIPTRGGVESRP